MSTIHEITDEQFVTEVLLADTPVLVEFWAPWCWSRSRASAPGRSRS